MSVLEKKGLFWLRLLISVSLIGFFISRVEAARLHELVTSIRFPYFFLALALVTAERFLLAYKWNVLLAAKKLRLPFFKIVKIYYLSNFVGTFFPSSIGVDIFRGYGLYRYNANASEAISSVFVDKILALFSLLVIVMVNAMLVSGTVDNPYIIPTILVLAAPLAICLTILLNKQAVTYLLAILGRMHSAGLQKFKNALQKIYNAFSEYMSRKGMLLYVLALSFLFQAIRAFGVYSVSLSLNQTVGVAYFFLFVPLIIILSMLPISLAGIGIREGAFVYFFSQIGMPVSDAFTLSLMMYVLSLIATAPGGFAYVKEGFFRD